MDGPRIYDNEPFQTAQLLPDALWDKLEREPLLFKPLFYQNQVFGYVVASAEESQRSAVNDLRLMVSLTMKGEKLIQERENAQKRVEWALDAMRSVNTRLSDISLRDELTGLYNRRGFIQEATRHLHTNPSTFLLVFIDMNGLKAINDIHGHDDGDLALKTTAGILKHCFRDRDILARIGGDEFAALVKEVGEEQIPRLEERFEARSRQESGNLGKPYQIAFARGYVQGRASSDLEALMNEADQRMYRNKKRMKDG
jgi:diguanylate cyclase (GGDEF)-like protein